MLGSTGWPEFVRCGLPETLWLPLSGSWWQGPGLGDPEVRRLVTYKATNQTNQNTKDNKKHLFLVALERNRQVMDKGKTIYPFDVDYSLFLIVSQMGRYRTLNVYLPMCMNKCVQRGVVCLSWTSYVHRDITVSSSRKWRLLFTTKRNQGLV